MKKLYFVTMLALYSASITGAEQTQRNILLSQGLDAIKKLDLDQVPEIIRKLRTQGAKRQVQILEQRLNEARLKVGKREGEDLIVRYQEAHERLQKDFDEIREENRDYRKEIDALKNEREALQFKLRDADRIVAEADAGIAEVKRKYEGYLNTIATLEKQITQQQEEHRRQLEENDPSGQIAELNKKITELQNEKVSLVDEVDFVKDKMIKVNQVNVALEMRANNLQSSLKATDKQLEEARAEAKKHQARIDELLGEKQKLENDLFARATVINGLKEENQRLEAEIARLKSS